MTAIAKLLDQTWAWAHQIDDPLAPAYKEDYKDFNQVNLLLTLERYNEAADAIDDMDTEPREEIIAAIAKDYGEDFVEKKLGWLV
jgi:hypothetical protein